MLKTKYFLPTSAIILSYLILNISSVYADSSISYTYKSSSPIQSGEVVSLESKKSSLVTPANLSNSSNFIGIVIAPKASSLEVNPSANSLQVTNTGSDPVLASTINGYINPGDKIGLSPLSGIAMKYQPGTVLIGIADSSLNRQTSGSQTKQIINKAGIKQTISIGYVMSELTINNNPNKPIANTKLSGLRNIVRQLTGRTASLFRIIISLIVAVLAIITLGILLFTSVFESIIAIGRNPLAKTAIKRKLTITIILSILLVLLTIIVINILLD